ncbi:hypothetical protein BGE01nite_40890 [Brevifollis gellanilyticus]|uniref:Uncharacterized protein n=2 Tax=Brevifollis gellanilyticus TaxID=748831 RepID=A0A512MDK9_9BACT|nr:hypothetical protein BGE01nite_40890 [Brevifollis gellanilyticus]
MDEERFESAQTSNAICRQYLGYDFIQAAEFWEAREDVAQMFCHFLTDAATAKNGAIFESLLGKDYKQKFEFKNRQNFGFTRHFVYAQKFDQRVFEKLLELGWARFDDAMYACELSNELCNVYMTLLACSISQRNGQPISTDMKVAEDIIRNPLFRKYFGKVLPFEDVSGRLQDFCISLLMRNNAADLSAKHVSMDEVLTVHEAARIRAGLESERKSFSDAVTKMVEKARITDPTSIPEFLALNAQEVISAAEDYGRLTREATMNNVDRERKKVIPNLSSGISITLPLAKLLIESSGNSAVPGIGSIVGTGFEMAALYLLSAGLFEEKQQLKETERTEIEKVHLFMNRLWDARTQRTGC